MNNVAGIHNDELDENEFSDYNETPEWMLEEDIDWMDRSSVQMNMDININEDRKANLSDLMVTSKIS